MKLSPIKQFLYTAIPFAVLGAAFKVMTLVEGLTEIRPANAIPIVAGLLFGPVAGLGCGIGNLIADFFGTMSTASVIGVIANFMAAFLPWKLWHLFMKEKPNVHTYKNIFIYILLSIISGLTVAWILSYGLEIVSGAWVQNIYRYVLYNNVAFSIGLGMPLFIVFTSDSVNVEPVLPRKKFAKDRPKGLDALIKWGLAIYTLVMLVIMVAVFNGIHPGNCPHMKIFSAIAIGILIFITIVPVYEREEINEKA